MKETRYYKHIEGETVIKAFEGSYVEVYNSKFSVLGTEFATSEIKYDGTFGWGFYEGDGNYLPAEPSDFHNAYHTAMDKIKDFTCDAKPVDY